MAENRHPGINMHKLPVGGGFVGFLFAGGCSLIFVLGFPTLWFFVALALALGVVVALFLKVRNNRRADRSKPLSILAAPEELENSRDSQPEQKPPCFQTLPTLWPV
jgi:hypothetical protein